LTCTSADTRCLKLLSHDQTTPERLVDCLDLKFLRDHAFGDDVDERSQRRGHAHPVDRLDFSFVEPRVVQAENGGDGRHPPEPWRHCHIQLRPKPASTGGADRHDPRWLARLMSLYSPDIMYFDVVPPLQFTGSAAVRDNFLRWSDGYKIAVDIRGLSILASRDIAVAHMLIRASGTLKDGREVGYWVRATVC
jgi:SnoaL-like domain